uniref:Venom protein family 2 protein 2 n=1 Tax=Pristhesancus plagipennis TaxID=1955184 RepID=A0A1Q1NPC8_PRIPG|nr:venom protein family 2 protein 2 [Pristhesancus plagipennis]
MRTACVPLLLLALLFVVPCSQTLKLVGVTQEFTLDKDKYDLRDYTPEELQALKELKEIKKSRSFISEVLPPKCDFPSWTEGSCCISFKWVGAKKVACLTAELLLKQLLLRIGLLWNDDVLFQHDIALAKFCIGVPYLNKINVCLQVYHLDIDLTVTPKFFRICGQILIASIFELRLNCMTIEGGKVTFDAAVEPEEVGIFALNFKDGRVVFEFNNPIPPEVMKVLKEIGNVIKKTFVDLGKKIVETAKNVWNSIKSWFSWW